MGRLSNDYSPPGGSGGSSVASQTGNAGKFLTTDGSTTSWATASGTNLGFIDITLAPYNADNTGTADCTAAIQAAINAAVTAGGGTLYFPTGTYKLSAAQTSGTSNSIAYSGQLTIPAQALGSVPRIPLRFLGNFPAAGPIFGPQTAVNEPVFTKGSIIKTTATSGNILVALAASSFGNMSNVALTFENLTFRAPNNPQCGGLDLGYAATASLRHVSVDVDASDSSITSPTGGTTGVILPRVNNAALVKWEHGSVTGWAVGIDHSEHAQLDYVVCYANLVGIQPRVGNHLSFYVGVGLYENVRGINVPTGGGGVIPITGTIRTEQGAAGNWYSTTYVIDDQDGKLHGDLKLQSVQSGVGPVNYFAAIGCRNVSLRSVYSGGPGSLETTSVAGSLTSAANALTMTTLDVTNGAPYPRLGVWGHNGSKGYNVSVPANDGIVTWYSPVAYPTVSADITLSSTTNRVQAGLTTRWIKNNNYLRIAFRIDTGATSGQVFLSKCVSGAQSNLGTSATPTLTVGTTYTLSVQHTATQIIVSVNGTVVITYTMTGPEAALFNPGREHGLYVYRGSLQDDGGSRWANLAVA